MSDPFLGEVKIFSGDFAPRGWALCNGQLLPINQNQALFAILGTTYGGNGVTNFALPDLRDRAAVHANSSAGPGLSPRFLGERGGEAAHTLTTAELPAHGHQLRGTSAATTGTPSATVVLAKAAAGAKVYRAPTNLVPMGAALAANSGGQAHENRQPFLAMNFIIAMQGIFPSR